MAASVAVGLFGLVAVVIWMSRSASDGGDSTTSETVLVDPRAEQFPTVSADVAEVTQTYLEGEGSQLVVMHEAGVEITDDLDPEACESAVARLNRVAPSVAVVRLIAGLADEVLAAALNSERRALGVALTTCVTAADAVSLRERMAAVADAATLVEVRLAQLEEAVG